jgi:hypothetical protein
MRALLFLSEAYTHGNKPTIGGGQNCGAGVWPKNVPGDGPGGWADGNELVSRMPAAEPPLRVHLILGRRGKRAEKRASFLVTRRFRTLLVFRLTVRRPQSYDVPSPRRTIPPLLGERDGVRAGFNHTLCFLFARHALPAAAPGKGSAVGRILFLEQFASEFRSVLFCDSEIGC